MAQWSSLYLHTPDSSGAAAALQAALTGYTLYDPFGLMPGRAYPQTVKMFVAPSVDDWTHMTAAPDALPDEKIIMELSRLALTLMLTLDGDQSVISVYHQGAKVETFDALTPVLRAGKTPDDLRAALQRTGGKHEASPFNVLSGEVKTMADKVNMKQAERMFTKMTGKLLNRDQQNAANQMLTGQTPQWDSTGGVRIRALVECLTLPSNWREPDFVTLRDAYQLHNRRRRNPNATLYPGDAEVMAAVPDALTYTPVFAGKA